MVRRAYGPGEIDALPPAPPRRTGRAWQYGSPVLRRPFLHQWQLMPSVWVCLADLSIVIMPAAEAMATRDPVEIGDGRTVRRFVRCERGVWRDLCARHPSDAIAHIRRAVSSVYTLTEIEAEIRARQPSEVIA